MNFVIFFYHSFLPLLASNPGDATDLLFKCRNKMAPQYFGRRFTVGRRRQLENATAVSFVQQTGHAQVATINGWRPRCTPPSEQSACVTSAKTVNFQETLKKLSCLTNHIIYNYIALCIFFRCFYWLCSLSLKLAYGRINLSFLIKININRLTATTELQSTL